MFRLIAIALVLTFALLGVTGTGSSPDQSRQASMMGMGLSTVGSGTQTDMRQGEAYVAEAPMTLRAGPFAGARVVAPLPKGAQVTLIDDPQAGFAQVRDADGRVGFVNTRSLQTPG